MYAFESMQCQSQEPIWRPCDWLIGPELPSSVRSWLLDEGSLTARLLRVHHGDFRVQLLRQEWQKPRPSESRLLNLRNREWVLAREVVLWGGGEPRVYARSVIPATSLRGRLRKLRALEEGSLGAMLFKDRSMSRGHYELARFDGNSPCLPNDLHSDQCLWGRRSRFSLRGRPLMVSEIFLPAFQHSVASGDSRSA